jgi:uncharacterized protein (DUF1330 family)
MSSGRRRAARWELTSGTARIKSRWMKAYLIGRVDVSDASLLKDYQAAVPPIVAQYGGKFLARGGERVTLEGLTETRRIVLIEFPGLAEAQAFYASPEYAEARKLREGIASIEFVAVAGL